MEPEHTDLKTLKWDSDEDGVYLGGRLAITGDTVIVAQCLSEIDAKAIVKACTSHEALLKMCSKILTYYAPMIGRGETPPMFLEALLRLVEDVKGN